MSSSSSSSDTKDVEKLPQWAKTYKPTKDMSTRSKIMNTQIIMLNTVSTVTIVFMNKMCVFIQPP